MKKVPRSIFKKIGYSNSLLAILGLVIFSLLVLSLSLGLVTKRSSLTKKAAEAFLPPVGFNNSALVPESAEGEVIIKLKSQFLPLKSKEEFSSGNVNSLGLDSASWDFTQLDLSTVPRSIQSLNKKFRIAKVEKVFKGAVSPSQEIAKFKQKFTLQITKGERKINEDQFSKIDLSKTYKLTFNPKIAIEDIILELAQSPEIEYVEPNYIVKGSLIPNDPDFNQLWGLNNTGQEGGTVDADIDLPESWELSSGSTQVLVGVIDSGIDYDHEDLKDNIWVNPGEIKGNGIDDDQNGYIDDIFGWNFVSNSSDPMDDAGHGTHVSGTIGAVFNNSLGIAGISPKVKLMALKFLDSQGRGLTDDAARAVRYANFMGAKITNNSWGGGGYSKTLYDAINEANSIGSLFMVASGNDAHNLDITPDYPSCYNLPNILSVSSTDRYDKLSSFSNYGINSVDVVAPGSFILSTVPGSYAVKSGTSMACPHVTGLAALLLSIDSKLSLIDLKSLIESNTDDLGSPGRDSSFSSGRINSQKSVESLIANNIVPYGDIISPEPESLVGATVRVTGTVGGRSFVSYRLEIGQGENPPSWTNNGIILAGDGNSPVDNNLIGTIDTSSYQNGIWTLRLLISGQNNSNFERRVVVNLDNSGGPGWPKTVGKADVSYQPDRTDFLVEDINNDGQKEVIAGADDGNVYVWSPGGNLLPGWPKYLGGELSGNASYSVPAAGDINNDGLKEIIVRVYAYYCPSLTSCVSEYNIHALNSQGAEIDSSWPKIGYFNHPVVIDIDNDGQKEVIAYNSNNNKLYIFNSDAFESSFTLSSGGSDYMSVSDLDNDTRQEIIFSKEGDVIVYKNDGSLMWKRNLEGMVSYSKPTLADLDGDKKSEVIVSSSPSDLGLNGKVWVFKSDGSNFPGWPKSDYLKGNTRYSSIAVGDIDNDTTIELVFGTNKYQVMVYDANGTAENVIYPEVCNFNRGAALADINSDGFSEIIIGCTPGNDSVNGFFAYDFKGNLVPGWPKKVYISSTPSVADIDADAKVEVIALGQETYYSNTKIFVFKTDNPYSPQHIDWPMYGHNAARTSNWAPPRVIPTSTPVATLTPTPVPPGFSELPAEFGTAIALSPDMNSFVQVPINEQKPQLNINQDLTVEFWVNRDSYSLDTNSWIINKRVNFPSSGEGDLYALLLGTNAMSEDFQTLFFHKSDTEKGLVFSSNLPKLLFIPNNWYHLAAVYGNSRVKLFINGRLVDDSALNESRESPNDYSLPLIIGKTNTNLKLDEVRISNFARDVAGDWAAGKYMSPLIVDENTMGLWHFDNSLVDSSPYRFDGVAQGTIRYINVAQPTITPTLVPTNTPTNTPTPTPTNTPTNVPTPTVTPKPNSIPEVITKILPSAQVGKQYQARIIVQDKDSDLLSVKISGLPVGIKYSCVNTKGKTNCTIYGITTRTGIYQVKVEADDKRGGTVKKYLPLYVIRIARTVD
ncbi:MAG: S8 family serine peptidase [Candidatus Shapirobacteria bacterium]|jgi:subtilisin family serine protease